MIHIWFEIVVKTVTVGLVTFYNIELKDGALDGANLPELVRIAWKYRVAYCLIDLP